MHYLDDPPGSGLGADRRPSPPAAAGADRLMSAVPLACWVQRAAGQTTATASAVFTPSRR